MNKMTYQSGMEHELPNNLRKLRERANISPEEMAEKVGWSTTTIWRHETGERDMNTKKLDIYAKAIGCKAEDILSHNSLKLVANNSSPIDAALLALCGEVIDELIEQGDVALEEEAYWDAIGILYEKAVRLRAEKGKATATALTTWWLKEHG